MLQKLSGCRLSVALTTVLASSCAVQAAEPPPLGDPRFQPSIESPVGWRGDGNGRFPAAEPPLVWSREAKAIKELRAQARKPREGETGKPIPDGVVREWLVLGPVDIPAEKRPADDFGTNEDQYAPDENAKSGELVWKSATTDTSYVDFRALFNKTLEKPDKTPWNPDEETRLVGYAHTWMYSPSGKPVFMNFFNSGTARVWLNGKAINSFGVPANRAKLPLVQGWNRLLMRVTARTTPTRQMGWHFNAVFLGTDPADYEGKNIVWATPMPDNGAGISSPIIVGDKIFVTGEMCDLICIRKSDGKALWARSTTYADVATEEEKKAHADVFAEIAPLQAKVTEILNAYCAAPERTGPAPTTTGESERKIDRLMKKVDRARYQGSSDCDVGESVATPASDGEHVYALFGSGVVACYDLNGNRKWATTVPIKTAEHGCAASPCLVDGKLVITTSLTFGAIALDCKTGATLWTLPAFTTGVRPYLMCSPIRATLNAEKLLVLSWGTVARASDGKVLAQVCRPWHPHVPEIESPAWEGKTIVSPGFLKDTVSIAFQTLPNSAAEPFKMQDVKQRVYDTNAFPTWWNHDRIASPLLYEGLAYLVNTDGVLTVMDAAKGEIVYQKLLDLGPLAAPYGSGSPLLGGCASSPTLGGKHIFLWDNQGTAIVIEPGRTFRQVARNRIEQLWYRGDARNGPVRQEATNSCPVFENKRLYYRGEVNLYCIGATDK